MKHLDKFGDEISVDDYVGAVYFSEIAIFKVVKQTPKMVNLTRLRKPGVKSREQTYRRYACDLIKLSDAQEKALLLTLLGT